MKKLLSICLMLLVLVTGLAACSASKGSKTFVKTEDDISMEVTLNYEGNEIKAYNMTSVIPLEEGADEEAMKEFYKSLQESESKVEGVTTSFDIADGKVKNTINVDLTKISDEDLKKNMGNENVEDFKDLKKAEESLKSEGFTEKK